MNQNSIKIYVNTSKVSLIKYCLMRNISLFRLNKKNSNH